MFRIIFALFLLFPPLAWAAFSVSGIENPASVAGVNTPASVAGVASAYITPPTIVQNGGGATFDGVTSLYKSFVSNVTTGNLIVVMVWKATLSSDAPVVGDVSHSGTATLGTWTLDKAYEVELDAGVYYSVGIFSAPVTGTGSCTPAVASVAAWGSIGILEVSGVDISASRVDTTAQGTGGVVAPTTAPFTTTKLGLICGSLVISGGDMTVTQSTDYTLIYEEEVGSAHTVGSAIYRISTGILENETTDWTSPNSGTGGYVGYVCCAVAYKGTP